LRNKREAFWRSTIDSQHRSPRQLWSSIDSLLGRGSVPASESIGATDFHQFFDGKVAAVRSSTADAPSPTFTVTDFVFNKFQPIKVDEVITAIRQLPDKQCFYDPIPTSLLKVVAADVAPFFVQLFNRSLQTGIVPESFKAACVTPLIKKSDLDAADVKSYRPISNLSVSSKLLERLVAKQLIDYLKQNNMLPSLQSAYRSGHSTETAVLKVLSDILLAVDSGDLSALALLDLSAAFDTVDHHILLKRLQISFGLSGSVLAWFRSYLSDRTQHVRYCGHQSAISFVLSGIPQGSVLGPILFLLYTAELPAVIERHGLMPHQYADDSQIYGSCRPSKSDELQSRLSSCIDDVACWMRSNRLQLNTSKTEIIWFASSRRQHQLPPSSVKIGADYIVPAITVRDLGIHLDSDVTMRTHVSKTLASCYSALRRLRTIRRSVPTKTFQQLVASLVLTRLDYGNATLVGLPACQIQKLQAVMNSAARLIFNVRKRDHITPLLKELNWLKVPERISYKLAVLTFQCLHGSAPLYLSESLRRVCDEPSRRRLRSSSTPALLVPSTRTLAGERAFPIAAARVWNSLPSDVTSSTSLSVFRRRLKSYLFSLSFPTV
jgi:hypothetical protein